MRDAGDSDGAGVEKAPAQAEEKPVELRKSCDYCVKLKRACDGKNPCSLCSRRHKPCTRSARKKSGPAKGTKYAPRRKRSIIAEWADRATLGARDNMLPHGFLGGGGIGLHGMGGGGGGRFEHHHLPMSAAEAAAATRAAGRPPYHGGGGGRPSQLSHPGAAAAAPAAGGRRYGGEVPQQWAEDRSSAEMGRMSSVSASGLPFPMGWYASGGREGPEAGDGGRGGGGGGGGAREHSRQLPPHLESPMGYAPTTAEALSRRAQQQQQQHAPLPRDAWPASSLEADGVAGERTTAGMEQSRRAWEPPSSGSWAGHSDPVFTSQAEGMALAYGKRVRLSPQSSSSVPGRPAMRPGGESSYVGTAGPSSRERGPAGRAAERHREIESDFFPPPREPADPTAGFAYPNRTTWRRSPHTAPWESSGGGGGGRNDPGMSQQFTQHSTFYDPSDRPSPSSWSSPGGVGGGGRGSGGDYVGGRRYYDDLRGDVGEARQERGGRDAGDWQALPPHGGGGGGGTDTFREREHLELQSFGRHQHQTMERPLDGEGEEQLLGAGAAAAVGVAARDERGRNTHEMFERGSADSAYEHTSGRAAGWPGGDGGAGADHMDTQHQRGRQESIRQEWEVRGGGGGGGGGVPFQWEESTGFDPSAQQELPRHEGESDRIAPRSSSAMGVLHGGRSSQANEEQRGGGRGSGGPASDGGAGEGQQQR